MSQDERIFPAGKVEATPAAAAADGETPLPAAPGVTAPQGAPDALALEAARLSAEASAIAAREAREARRRRGNGKRINKQEIRG